MSKITNEITTQDFELIRNKIGFILSDELAEQHNITGNELFNSVVWLERFIPFDMSELPAINVYYINSSYEENTPVTSVGTHQFNIEVLVSAKSTDLELGDKIAIFKAQKLAGVIRYIMESPYYLNLDFAEKFIFNTKVSNINISQPSSNQNELHTVSGQIIFEVKSEQNNGAIVPIAGELATSTQKINESEKGYYIEI